MSQIYLTFMVIHGHPKSWLQVQHWVSKKMICRTIFDATAKSMIIYGLMFPSPMAFTLSRAG